MLLAVNVNNTRTALGLFDARGALGPTWRVRTDRARTPDELAALWRGMLDLRDLPKYSASAAILASVVPASGGAWHAMCADLLGIPVAEVCPDGDHGMTLDVDHPAEVGADRIANCVAARDLWGAPAIVVDLGTALTFDAVSREGHYVGGAIAPGISIAAQALAERTAKLPHVALTAPERAVGRDTVSAMRSGIVFGFAGQVDAMVARIAAELGGSPKVLATGGDAPLVAGVCRSIDEVVPELTLQGMALIACRLGIADAGAQR